MLIVTLALICWQAGLTYYVYSKFRSNPLPSPDGARHACILFGKDGSIHSIQQRQVRPEVFQRPHSSYHYEGPDKEGRHIYREYSGV